MKKSPGTLTVQRPKKHQMQFMRWLSITLMVCIGVSVTAQNQKIQIEKFERNSQDVTAQTYPVKDPTSHKNCALIIFKNVGVGKYEFSVNSYSKREDKTENGEPRVWLYVAPGTKSITVANKAVSNDTEKYNIGYALEAGKTYIATMGTVYAESNQKQFIIFHLIPPTASLEVDGRPVQVASGNAEEMVKMGQHQIRAIAPEYHDYVDIVIMDDPSKAKEVTIELQPRFGFLSIEGGTALTDAVVTVDGLQKGIGNVYHIRLESGEHTLKINKRLYQPYEATFPIVDGQTTVVQPILTPDFSETTLSVANNAEIWIDGKKLANGRWTGPLERGVYIVETRLPSHKPHREQISIETINAPHEITIGAPTPIYGSISVTSTPSGASVMIDGKAVGKTPYIMNNALIGRHDIEVSQTGYENVKRQVVVTEDETIKENFILSNTVTAMIFIEPQNGSRLTVDGKAIEGSSPFTIKGNLNQIVHLTASNDQKMPGYKSQSWDMALSRNGLTQSIYLKPKKYPYYPPRGYYIDLGGSVCGINGLSANMGYYFGKTGFNAEFNYIYGLSPSDEIYWNNYPDSNYLSEYVYNHDSESYSAMSYGFKLGYGIRINRSWNTYINDGYGKGVCITPQLGLRHTTIKGDGEGYNTFITSGTFDVRIELRTACHFGFYITPEYCFPVSEGKIYKAIKDVSSKVKGFGNGFNLLAGFSIII